MLFNIASMISMIDGVKQLFIKLSSGGQVNLDSLDKLADKQVANSIFTVLESKYGNGDGTFQQSEIDILKRDISQYLDDNTISQEELDIIFGKKENGDSKVQIRNFEAALLDSLQKADCNGTGGKETNVPDSIPSNPADTTTVSITPQNEVVEEEPNVVYTNYKIQPGDTPKKIVEKLKLTGEEAEKLEQELNNIIKSRKPGKQFFVVGEIIKLAGDYKEQIAALSDYSEDDNVLNQKYIKAVEEKQKRQIPSAVRSIMADLQSKGIKFEYKKTKTGAHVIIRTSGEDLKKESGLVKIYDKYDKNGHLMAQQKEYTNGDLKIIPYDSEGKVINDKIITKKKGEDKNNSKTKTSSKKSSMSIEVPKMKPKIKEPSLQTQAEWNVIEKAKNEARQIANEINNALAKFNKDNSRENIRLIKAALSKIDKYNVAHVVKLIPDIAQKIDNVDFYGFGLGSDDVFKYVLGPMQQRAKELGISQNNRTSSSFLSAMSADIKRIHTNIINSDSTKLQAKSEYDSEQKQIYTYNNVYKKQAEKSFEDANNFLVYAANMKNKPKFERVSQSYGIMHFDDGRNISIKFDKDNKIKELSIIYDHSPDSMVTYTKFQAYNPALLQFGQHRIDSKSQSQNSNYNPNEIFAYAYKLIS